MTSDDVKLQFPVGWEYLVDYLFNKMREFGVPEEKLIGVHISQDGYAIFYYALMPLKMFNDIRQYVYDTQIRSHKSCVECGGYSSQMSETSLPLCSIHIKMKGE